MLFKRTTLYVTLMLLIAQTTSMQSSSPPHQNNNLNKKAINRANTILSHINPPNKQVSYTLQNCSAKQINLRAETPEQIELLMQDPTNIPLLRKEISNGICQGQVTRGNLEALLRNPDLANYLIQHALDNFVELTKYSGKVLEIIMTTCPATVQKFVQPAIDNFQMCNTWDGQYILRTIMQHHSGAAQAFVQPATVGFSQMCNNYKGCGTLKTIIKYCPPAAQTFVQPAIDNFSQICNNEDGWYLLEEILKYHSDAAQGFVQPAIDNFFQICNNASGWYLLEEILRHHPDAAQALVQPAIDNFSQMCNNYYGWYILEEIIKHYPKAKKIFAEHIMAKQSSLFYPFNDLVKNKTQTKQHLITNLIDKYKKLSSEGHTNYQDHPNLQVMTKQIINLEYKEQQKGRYTFVHAHQWAYHFYQEFYTDLWSIINEKPSNYRFTRFKYPIKPSTEAFFAYIKNEQEAHQKIMTDNAFDQNYIIDGYQNYLLFMNYALFSNCRGANTGYYIKSNRSAFPIQIDCNQFLSELHLDDLLTQEELELVRKQFNELQQEHATISEYGGGLLLSFTPELMAECVYSCHGNGKKRTVKIKGVGETSDLQIILDTLRTTPEKIVDSDNIEFVCVLSHDAALIPYNGLDIYEFNAADQNKLAAWRAKKDTLMDWIKERVNKRRQALAAQAATQKMRARL